MYNKPMLRKNLFIIFTGIDNAGKSSQINILKSSFLSNGKKVYTFWARGGYTPNFEILKFLMRKIFSNKNTESRNNKIRKRIFKNQFLSKLWINIAILDLIYYWCIVLRLKLIFGYQVICDRYYEDTFLDFKINFPNINFEKLPLWKLLFFFFFKPDFSFLLYVDV